MFADDMKIYKTINSQADVKLLQIDIDRVYAWCTDNGMYLNIEKCSHIKFTRKKSPIDCVYKINNVPLKEVSSIRDLGVIIDSNLSFRQHVDHIVAKASKISGLVYRQMKIFKEPTLSILVFNTIVRSILEYCSIVWNPGYQVHSDRIERIQKRFLYHLSYSDYKSNQLFSYNSRLTHYGIKSLKERRKIADVIFLCKIIKGLIEAPELLERLTFVVPRSCSRVCNRKTFSLPLNRTNLGHHSPLYRMQFLANSFRDTIDIFCDSIPIIKKKLNLYTNSN